MRQYPVMEDLNVSIQITSQEHRRAPVCLALWAVSGLPEDDVPDERYCGGLETRLGHVHLET